jgi:hypothetical protein
MHSENTLFENSLYLSMNFKVEHRFPLRYLNSKAPSVSPLPLPELKPRGSPAGEESPLSVFHEVKLLSLDDVLNSLNWKRSVIPFSALLPSASHTKPSKGFMKDVMIGIIWTVFFLLLDLDLFVYFSCKQVAGKTEDGL